jgi:D-alanine-D-alanine ligase-like ATP-grasp enzyme
MTTTPQDIPRLKEALLQRGYTPHEIVLDRKYTQYYSPSGKLAIVQGAVYYHPYISTFASKVSRNKLLSYQFANTHGVTTPKTVQTGDREAGARFLDKYRRIIVKPHDGGGGQGLTLDVTDHGGLMAAMDTASFNGHDPILQEQFIGEELRFAIIKGKVRSVILRRTPRVIGDGVSSVRALVEKENRARLGLSFPFLSYPQLTGAIIDESLLESSDIAAKGQVVELSKATMIGQGASFYGVTQEVHPSYIAIAERLALALNPTMLIVDLMVRDYRASATPDNYIFLEFNTAPSMTIYSCIRGGDMPDVPSMVADVLDEYVNIVR